ncbi:hypothetical protein Vwe01_50040 [Micromonospora andamanensis]|nr:hypothetical protein Vwe01_50040 [Micromonospora andamanensis]
MSEGPSEVTIEALAPVAVHRVVTSGVKLTKAMSMCLWLLPDSGELSAPAAKAMSTQEKSPSGPVSGPRLRAVPVGSTAQCGPSDDPAVWRAPRTAYRCIVTP